jgi:hypothetical protein
MKVLFINTLFLFVGFIGFSQKNNLDKLTDLYKKQASIESQINQILKDDPQLNKLLDSYSNLKISESKNSDKSKSVEFTEKYFELEAEKIKAILSENNLNKIKELFYSVQNSAYAKDISYIVLRQMEIARDDLEAGIKELPRPKN